MGPPALPGQTVSYEILPSEESRFALEVEKTRLMSGKRHLFLAERYRGRIDYDPETPEKSHVEMNIESASLVCKDTWLSAKDLRKVQAYALDEMLAAEKYPEIRFSSRAIESLGANRFQVSGELTIREISRPVRVNVSLSSATTTELVFGGTATVEMRDYGLKPPTAVLGMIGTKNDMTVSFQLRATRQQ